MFVILAALICEATFDKVVELAATVIPLILMLCPEVTLTPADDSIVGKVLCQALDPTCTQAIAPAFVLPFCRSCYFFWSIYLYLNKLVSIMITSNSWESFAF